MVTPEMVYAQLRECFDPEIPVNIVDLGLCYDVQVEGDEVKVKMTLTSAGCPAAQMLPQQIRERLSTIPGVRAADVEVVWDPPWNPEMISPEGKKRLGLTEE